MLIAAAAGAAVVACGTCRRSAGARLVAALRRVKAADPACDGG